MGSKGNLRRATGGAGRGKERGDRTCHLGTGSISSSRSSGPRVLPCVNATIIYESHHRLIDEEINRRFKVEGKTGTELC